MTTDCGVRLPGRPGRGHLSSAGRSSPSTAGTKATPPTCGPGRHSSAPPRSSTDRWRFTRQLARLQAAEWPRVLAYGDDVGDPALPVPRKQPWPREFPPAVSHGTQLLAPDRAPVDHLRWGPRCRRCSPSTKGSATAAPRSWLPVEEGADDAPGVVDPVGAIAHDARPTLRIDAITPAPGESAGALAFMEIVRDCAVDVVARERRPARVRGQREVIQVWMRAARSAPERAQRMWPGAGPSAGA